MHQLTTLCALTLAAVQATSGYPAQQPKIHSQSPIKLPPESAITAAANVSTGNPSKCPKGTKYFLQPINHAGYDGTIGDNTTFLQQYEISDEFYKPGGPIIFIQGTENAHMSCLEEYIAPAWVKELGGIAVALEHRYFGVSCPYGLNYTESATWDPALLKPLTLDNVLLDAATFVQWVKQSYHGTENSKIIVASGSYGGTLAALLRIHYPETFFGAIASSLLTTGLVSDPKAPTIFTWGDWANQVYNGYSYEASQRIRIAMSALRNQVSKGNLSNLQEAFTLCNPPKTVHDGELVVYSLMESYIENLQLNLAPYGYPFYALINATLALPDDASHLTILNEMIKITNEWRPAPCFDWDPGYATGGPYQYLQCTYLPQLNGFTSNSSIWGVNSPDLFIEASKGHTRLLDPWCMAAFNISSVDGGPEYQRSLGLDLNTIKATPRLLLTAGLLDPVTAAGTPAWYPGQHTMEDSSVYYISGAAHAADLIAENEADSQGLNEARIAYVNIMKAWLAGTDL